MFGKGLLKELKDHITNKAIELEVANKRESRDTIENINNIMAPVKVENLKVIEETRKMRKEVAKLNRLLEEDINRINERIDKFGSVVKDMQKEKGKANVAGFKEGLERVKTFLEDGKKEVKKVEQMTIDGNSVDIKDIGLADPSKEPKKMTEEEYKKAMAYVSPAKLYSVDDLLRIGGYKSRSTISRKISKICEEEHISKGDRRYWYKASNGYDIGNGKEGKEWIITELGKKKILSL